MRTRLATLGLAGATVVLLISFQNCAKFSVSESFASLSASCTAKIQEKAPELLKAFAASDASSTTPSVVRAPVDPGDCDRLENYSCESREFAPGIGDSKVETAHCLGDSSCVRLTKMTFDTKTAMKPGEEEFFKPGGDYNHVEARCAHHARFRDAALFTGEGDDLTSALQAAKSRCLAALIAKEVSR